ncbi:hypothetical protein [Ruegeria sp. R14_0]|uniref:hypothetical protein n=1 Tax=Ruegeria sp. R14_0 TaxID=2821100 RepID=UPI001ADCE036|nr:hypothetical protein [Ruegeria sp. R14_0]MBO9447429.1 hypothetical protein [Ruegeria sp. R14_0]
MVPTHCILSFDRSRLFKAAAEIVSHLSCNLQKTKAGWSEEEILPICKRLRPSIESGSAFENTRMSDVETAVEVTSTIDGFLE